MAYTGAKSSIWIAKESTWGTSVAIAAATKAAKLPFTSESLNYKQETIKSEALLGNRGIKSLMQGKTGVEGSIDVEAFPEIIGMLFWLALGKNAAPTSTGTTITQTDLTTSLPSFTAVIDHSSKKISYSGLKVNQLKFSGAVGGIPKITIDVVGKDETLDPSFTTPTTPFANPSGEPYIFKEMALYKDDFTTIASIYSSFDLTINNNLVTDDYRMDGTGKRGSLDEGQLEATGTVSMMFDVSAFGTGNEYDKFKNLSDATVALKLSRGGKDFKIKLPRVKFTEMPHDISGSDKIELKGSFTALLDSNNIVIQVDDPYLVSPATTYLG